MRASTIISSKACLFILKFGPSARQQGQTLQIRVIPRSVVSLLLLLLLGWGHGFFLLTYLGLSEGFPWIKENKGKPSDNREWKKNLVPRAGLLAVSSLLQMVSSLFHRRPAHQARLPHLRRLNHCSGTDGPAHPFFLLWLSTVRLLLNQSFVEVWVWCVLRKFNRV